MWSTSRLMVLALVVALAGASSGCDDRPRGRLAPTSITRPTTPVALAVAIGGPESVAPGTSVQFSAIQHWSDGSTRDVTGEAAWQSSDESILALSPTGLAKAGNRGEVSITAVVGSTQAVKNDVMVLPAGTFRLAGSVRDAGFPVYGVQVRVTDGEGSGLSAVAEDGTYRLYGVAGDVEVVATAVGYAEVRRRLAITAHYTLDLNLTPSAPREHAAGTYTLTVSAAAACAATLPQEARVRTYRAIVTQDGPRTAVTLEGARFFTDSSGSLNRFEGLAQPDRLLFHLAAPFDYFFYLPQVLEELTTPTSRFLALVGDAVTFGSGRVRSGTLNGLVQTMNANFQRIATCRSSDHRFVLSQ